MAILKYSSAFDRIVRNYETLDPAGDAFSRIRQRTRRGLRPRMLARFYYSISFGYGGPQSRLFAGYKQSEIHRRWDSDKARRRPMEKSLWPRQLSPGHSGCEARRSSVAGHRGRSE